MRVNKSTVFSIFILLLFVALAVLLFIDLIPLLKQVVEHMDDEAVMVSYMEAYGAQGVPILVGLQMLQAITAFFPAAAIQILAGLCYGVWFGTLICFVGYVAGNALVFFAVRQFGKILTPFFRSKDKTPNPLTDGGTGTKRKPEDMAFLLYLIPVIPNGLITYILAGTKMKPSKFLVNMTIACIPSIFLCTWLGERISHGDYSTAIIFGGILAAAAIAAFFLKNKIMDAK